MSTGLLQLSFLISTALVELLLIDPARAVPRVQVVLHVELWRPLKLGGILSTGPRALEPGFDAMPSRSGSPPI